MFLMTQLFALMMLHFSFITWISCTKKCRDGEHFFTNCSNPCAVNGSVTVCEYKPEAVCIPEYCGGCVARFYDNKSNEIHCLAEEGVICEMKTHTIGCETDKVIIMSAANYGRTSSTTCRHPFNIEKLHNDTDCRAPSSLSVMKTLCDQRRLCTVTVDGKLFGADPCYGTYKYLEFNYTCVKHSRLTSLPDAGSSVDTGTIIVAVLIPSAVLALLLAFGIYYVKKRAKSKEDTSLRLSIDDSGLLSDINEAN